jgi:hypothetical protein
MLKIHKILSLSLIVFLLGMGVTYAQKTTVKIGLLKYNGGGDWYANPTSLPNLIAFCNKELGTEINPEPDVVDASSAEIINYPFIHLTGHGNIVFSSTEVDVLRNYLNGGGFLHIDDNYGMDKFARREIKKLFPNQELVEIPFNHPIYHQKYNFTTGVPKIHEHDGKPAQAFGIFINGRLALLYTYETDLGDGWEDIEVHKDPQEVRLKALQMGANIIQYIFMKS